MPVTPMPMSTRDRVLMPSAIAVATASLTAPCAAIVSPGTPRSSIFEALL
jgi:hypothetical protein